MSHVPRRVNDKENGPAFEPTRRLLIAYQCALPYHQVQVHPFGFVTRASHSA